ncbi:unnamed protein product [Lactuca virosa]|uniref:Uncharacterized protein n=1 Tax=Lactuca virosa TaxID=75947 RepID=A0AAU9NDX7_9ASTR|nr:unnamed protein product [Lactuca virosa]
MASTTDSSVVIPIPIPSDTVTGNEESVGVESVDMEASIMNPPPASGRKEATMPTLITLAVSLPQFQRPFAVPTLEGLNQLRNLHEQTKKEAKGLREEVSSLSERNQNLVTDLSQAIGQQEELKKLNQDLQLKPDDVMSHRTFAVKELEGVSQYDFDVVNATLQTSAIQLGLHQACVDIKEKYLEELEGKNVLYLYPDAQHQIIERFAEMTTYKYSLVYSLENEEMVVCGLRKLLKVVDLSGADEVGLG